MGDIFNDTVSQVVANCDGVAGAAFTDFDGEEIALYPKSLVDELRLYAAYGGIAIRRLSAAESRASRGDVMTFVVRGTQRSLVSMRVGDNYQLAMLVDSTANPAVVVHSSRSAVKTLEDNL